MHQFILDFEQSYKSRDSTWGSGYINFCSKQWRRQDFSLGGAEGARRRGGWGAVFDLEMAHFDAHLRYSDVLILKFCFAT